MKTKLFLDFDGTVFDTIAYGNLLWDVFVKAGFELDEIESTYKAECLDYKYSPEGHAERLAKLHEYNEVLALSRIERLYGKVKSLIFDDVSKFLGAIDRELYEVDLLSLGDIAFQKKKIKASGLVQYFDNTFVTEKQKWDYLPEIISENERFVIIDDRGDAMEKVSKEFRKAMAIEINRNGGQYDIMEQDNRFNGVKVKSLNQAIKYL